MKKKKHPMATMELDYMAMILTDFDNMDEILRLNLIHGLLEDLGEADREVVMDDFPLTWRKV